MKQSKPETPTRRTEPGKKPQAVEAAAKTRRKRQNKGKRATVEVMTPTHPRWREFMDHLAGPEGCNFRQRSEHDSDSWTWTCACDSECPISRRILAAMGFSDAEIELSIAYFKGRGGCCDCEVLLNVDR